MVGAAVSLAGMQSAEAQEPVRSSLAGEEAAAGLRQQAPTDYNVRIGQVRFKVTANLRTEFNDNVTLSDKANPTTAPVADIIFRPGVDIVATWPLTAYNSLRLKVGLSAERHLNQPELDTSGFLIAPGSELNLSVFVGDIRADFFDRFGLEQDPVTDPTLSNVSGYGRFTNAIGLNLTWDLNQIIAGLGYQHEDVLSTTPNFEYLNSSTDQISFSGLLLYAPELQFGLYGQVANVRYQDPRRGDILSGGLGPGVQWILSRYTKIAASAGIQAFSFAEPKETGMGQITIPGLVVDRPMEQRANPYIGYYGSLMISNRLTSYYTQELDFSLNTSTASAADLITTASVIYQGDWRVNRYVSLSLGLGYENVEETQGGGGEKLTRFSVNLGAAYQLTPHLNVGLRYNFLSKDSDLQFRDYVQNAFVLDLRYDF